MASDRPGIALGIGMVYQETSCFPNLSVAANIFAGRELTAMGGRLQTSAMRARTRALLDELHLAIHPDARAEFLSTAPGFVMAKRAMPGELAASLPTGPEPLPEGFYGPE